MDVLNVDGGRPMAMLFWPCFPYSPWTYGIKNKDSMKDTIWGIMWYHMTVGVVAWPCTAITNVNKTNNQ